MPRGRFGGQAFSHSAPLQLPMNLRLYVTGLDNHEWAWLSDVRCRLMERRRRVTEREHDFIGVEPRGMTGSVGSL